MTRAYRTTWPALRRGFTLLELVVVMAILAILAGIAIRSFDGLDQQARFDATRRTMQNVKDATLATGADADGSVLITGFVADMGRLPKAAIGSDGTLQSVELFSNSGGALQTFAVQASLIDSEVLVACGWRGDYLSLGIGQSVVQDGWGKAFDLQKADGTAAGAGDPIAAIHHAQLDPSYDADMTTLIGGTGGFQATVTGRVYQIDATTGLPADPDPAKGPVVVFFFGPDGAAGKLSAVQASVVTEAGGTAVSYVIGGTVGPRVIRAYQGPTINLSSPGTTAVLRSVPVRLMLQPGGQAKDLTLR